MKFLLMVVTVTVLGLASCKKDDGCVTCKKYPHPQTPANFMYEEICEGNERYQYKDRTDFHDCAGMPTPCTIHYIYDCTY